MTLQQFNYPTCSTNIPQIYQQTDQHLPQHPTSKFLPIEEDPENDIEEDPDTEMQTTSKQPWQVLKERKSKLSPDVPQVSTPFQIKTQNRYEQIIQLAVEDTLTNNINKTTTNSENITIKHKPPPIFIYGVTNYNQMVEYPTTAVKEEQYYCKTLLNGTIKVNTSTSDSCRKLIKLLRQDNIIFHTYQLREERANRVVIRNLHPSIRTETIKQEIAKHGHAARNVTNTRHREQGVEENIWTKEG
jgi:hypothetical protein